MSDGPAKEVGPSGAELRLLAPDEPHFEPALALVLSGRPTVTVAAEAQICSLRQAVQQQRLSMDLMAAAFDRGRLVSAALGIESPGKTALVYTPPGSDTGRHPGALADVLALLGRAAAPRGVNLLQALLGREDNARAEAHAKAGFTYLAELIYLERSTASSAEAQLLQQPRPEIQLVTYEPRRRGLFCEALAATYENSLDCPKLNGLRSLEDVLDGHMATGIFEPAGWRVALSKQKPVGVVLAAVLPSRTAVEVVYMGVAASARGQGVGNFLMASALDYARSRSAPTLSLAVDSTNAPARRLYARWRLQETTRRRAWIMPLAPGGDMHRFP